MNDKTILASIFTLLFTVLTVFFINQGNVWASVFFAILLVLSLGSVDLADKQ